VDYWHWLLIEIDSEISAFCEEPVPRNHVGAKMAALADVWLMRTDGSIEFRSVARSDKQVSTTRLRAPTVLSVPEISANVS
jgi:hypothetical protein